MRSDIFGLALALAAGATLAQPVAAPQDEAPTPPPLHTTGLVPVEVGGGSTLKFGVDPASVQIEGDTVRYVVIASSTSGAVNAMYEGLRCRSADVRTYARYAPGTGWVPAKDDWKPLTPEHATRHSLAIARAGVCREKGPNGSPEQIVRDLARPIGMKFEDPPR